jgi:hypothetical protein
MMSVDECNAPEQPGVESEPRACQVGARRSSLFALLVVTAVACSSGSGTKSDGGAGQIDVGGAADGGIAAETAPTATGGSAGLDGFGATGGIPGSGDSGASGGSDGSRGIDGATSAIDGGNRGTGGSAGAAGTGGILGGLGGTAGSDGPVDAPGAGGTRDSGGLADAPGAGGTADSGGNGGSGAGIVTFDTFAFYKPTMVAGPDGVLHMIFNLNTSPSDVRYARCVADCGRGSNWAVSIIGSGEFTGSTRLAVGADNRVHVLYEVGTTSGSSQLRYATCASNCSEPASWTTTNLESLFGGGWLSPSRGIPLAIDAQNRLSFTVDRSTYTDGGFTLATCASGCGTLANWSAGRIRANGIRTAMVARGTTLHQIVDNDTPSANATALSYRTCASNCTQQANWQELPNFFAYDGSKPLAIAVTAAGGLRVVYNQGVAATGESAQVKAQDNRILFWSCDANCLQAGSWSGTTLGASGDGADGLAMVEFGGALVVAVTNGSRVFAGICGQDCLTESNWQVADIDSTEAMTANYDPYLYTGDTCSGTRPISATWNMETAVVAIRPDGAVAFAHAVSILRMCASSTGPVYIPGFGRVVFAP